MMRSTRARAELLARVAALEASLQRETAERKRLEQALAESLEQQTATSEILRVISSSPADVQPVFDAIVRSAVKLCDGLFCVAYRFDGELIHVAAHHNQHPEALGFLGRLYLALPGNETVGARSILERAVIHIEDATADWVPPGSRALARQLGFKTIIAVPMLREGQPIGSIAVARRERALFTDNRIDLLKTFADQAVIAIENVRLFTELQDKNHALTEAHAQVTEALEQQTATAEILRVISSSPIDLQPVFDTIVRNAVKLCGAAFGGLQRLDGGRFTLDAQYGVTG